MAAHVPSRVPMSQRRNYGFERRRKEESRRVKHEAKLQRKSERAEGGLTGPEMGEAATTGTPPGQWEWFSPSRGRTMGSASGVRPSGDLPDDWILLTDVSEEPAEPS